MRRLPAWTVRLWRQQQLYLLVGLAAYIILVSLRLPVSLPGTLVSSLIGGNILTVTLGRLQFTYSRYKFPKNWLVFSVCLLLVTPVAVSVAVLVVGRLMFPPEVLTWRNVEPYWEFSCIATVLVGLASYAYMESRQRFERRTVELEAALNQGTARLEMHDQELQRAREIQESLLPREIPQIEGFEIAGTWHPARTVGGDYFDILKLTEEKLSFCIADVVGKGVSAALLMANIQAAVRAFASPTATPAGICAKINDVLCRNIADSKFVTFFYALLDTRGRVLTYCNAGHLRPLHLSSRGRSTWLSEGGMVLGVSPHAHYEDGEIHLGDEDRLLLFTDGITEAGLELGDEYGEQRIESMAKRHMNEKASDLVARVMADVEKFCNSRFMDDATMVVLAAVPARESQQARSGEASGSGHDA